MWLIVPFAVLISSCSCATEITDCKESLPLECLNGSRVDHLECLTNLQVTSITELLHLFEKNQQQIIDLRQEMEKRLGKQQSALELLHSRRNSSLTTTPSNSSQSCLVSTAFNTTGVLVNPRAMARSTGPIKSCYDLRYTDQALLQLSDASPPFWVLCIEQHVGGGWLVIQQRVFGVVSFFRNWIEYREGFGSLDSEFWLGLEKIHRITRSRHHELLIEMTDYYGHYKFARYARFEIAGEDEDYALLQLGSYSGTVGDSLRAHMGMKFSTYDSDNTPNVIRNCGVEYSAGWWFDKCFLNGTNLNGEAVKTNDIFSIFWFGWSPTSLKFTRMMLRTVE